MIVTPGSIHSSIKYSNWNDGNAIAINIRAGVIVHINSICVPCIKYLCDICRFPELKFINIIASMYATIANTNDIYTHT